MTCKDCIHWRACKDSAYDYYGEYAASAYDDDSCCKGFAETCSNFSDKSEWIYFPSKDYKTASSNTDSQLNLKQFVTCVSTELQKIHDLCIGYDGFNTVDGLKSLIDDIRGIAEKNLAGKERA